jgi:CMP-2-keto-3-deoxyoctulosonic acid synthetase
MPFATDMPCPNLAEGVIWEHILGIYRSLKSDIFNQVVAFSAYVLEDTNLLEGVRSLGVTNGCSIDYKTLAYNFEVSRLLPLRKESA